MVLVSEAYSKGSLWRKWDLHVHTPYSINQNYGSASDDDVWEKYISDLEALPEEVKVIGVNDYLFIDGYERLLREKNENGRIGNIDLLLPVVEFRIEKFAGVKFGNLKRINMHVIFSNEVTPEVIKAQFLSSLNQSYKLGYGVDGSRWSGVITKESLSDLGKSIKESVPEAERNKYGSDIQEGFNNLNFDEKVLMDSLAEKHFFDGKYLVAVGKTEWGSLSWSDGSILTKKDIINKSDLVFVASESVEEFHKAKDSLREQGVNDLLLDCSDAHDFSESDDKDRIGNCNTWIKADPTFEGLKQILYEPSRVRVSDNKPDDKVGYQVIDRIEIDSHIINNQCIEFNENMNSIIGGRSTGKSVLLTAIAQKLKATKSPFFPDHKAEYKDFVKRISDSFTVYWKDGEINDEREIEFFQQGYMNDLATSDAKLSGLVQSILKNKGKGELLDQYHSKRNDLKKSISSCVADLFQTIDNIKERSSEMSEKGDLNGVKEEISRLEARLKEIGGLDFDDNERADYQQKKISLDGYYKLRAEFQSDANIVRKYKDTPLLPVQLGYDVAILSEKYSSKLHALYSEIRAEAEKKWLDGLDAIISDVSTDIENQNINIEVVKNSPVFVKANSAYERSAKLKDIQGRIKEQKEKQNEIESIGKIVDELKVKREGLKKDLLSMNKEYYLSAQKILPELSSCQDELKIEARSRFMGDNYRQILEGALNLQTKTSKDIVDFEINNDADFFDHLAVLLERLVSGEINLKGGYTSQSLATAILAECFYDISYDLIYENDNFNHMSDGKKAFVVLKLLLDFSDKDCPILIDQPEDDLDNRAIYLDLVKYLERKKRKRQIILATHNPNVVVGGDSELVIVANQHGVNTKNLDGKKFAYKAGSLENSKSRDGENPIVLESQGIREHVCDVLEGGGDAFRLRENKYGLRQG
jgi:predicted ATPase